MADLLQRDFGVITDVVSDHARRTPQRARAGRRATLDRLRGPRRADQPCRRRAAARCGATRRCDRDPRSDVDRLCRGVAAGDDELLRWLNERVAKTQRLAALHCIDELPRSAIGKVLKRELRERHLDMTKEIPR